MSDKDITTPEEQIENLTAKLEELTATVEAQRVELEGYRNEKGVLLKDLKRAKDEREALLKAQMSEEEKAKADTAKVADLEAVLERERAEALRYKILSTTNHGLDASFAKLVTGTDEASVLASIEEIRLEQAEAVKRLAPPGSKGTAPEPPPNAGGAKPLLLTEKDIMAMSSDQFRELERKIGSGEVEIPT